jgi:DNA anti-recombination protein RmuC
MSLTQQQEEEITRLVDARINRVRDEHRKSLQRIAHDVETLGESLQAFQNKTMKTMTRVEERASDMVLVQREVDTALKGLESFHKQVESLYSAMTCAIIEAGKTGL